MFEPGAPAVGLFQSVASKLEGDTELKDQVGMRLCIKPSLTARAFFDVWSTGSHWNSVHPGGEAAAEDPCNGRQEGS
jgi:hypothetical protein